MTPERYQQIGRLYHDALALAPERREAFLDRACAGDAELRREVEALIASHEQAESFMAAPALQVAAETLAQEQVQSPVGRMLGHYQILSLIGVGGMGEVYRAHDTRLGREVAIKVLPAALSQDANRLRRFEQEARAAGRLNHPNILTIYEVGTQDGSPYIVSELLEGETLRARLKSASLSPRRAIDYAIQMARGLAAAHEKGVVHRDLKPENLFITRDGRLKILDFGLAKFTQPKLAGSDEAKAPANLLTTEPGIVMGTAAYMSPEQVRGRDADHRSDLFTFGSILYEMLAGRRAFEGESGVEVMSAILKEEPPEITQLNQQVSPGLAQVVRYCLQKRPEARFQSATDLGSALENLTAPAESHLANATTALPTAKIEGARAPHSASRAATPPPQKGRAAGPHLIAHRKEGKEAAIIFIHGFRGNPRRTWGKFPDILASDRRLRAWDIFSLGYSTKLSLDLVGIWSADPELEILARFLHTAADNYPLCLYKRLVLIAHSMGGLLVQRALLDYDDLAGRVSHVFLFATPSAGLTKASLVSRFKRQWRDLRQNSEFIRDLRARWKEKFGQAAPFQFVSVAGDRDEFVPWTSSIAPFDKAQCKVVPGNHLQVVKPASGKELSVQLILKGLVGDAELAADTAARAPVATSGQKALDATGKFSAQRTGAYEAEDLDWGSEPPPASEGKGRKRGLILALLMLILAAVLIARFARDRQGIDSVAVLPFQNASADPNTEYLCEGITDGIVNSLSRVSRLRVVPWSKVSRYRGREVDPQAVGRELGVHAVLVGKVAQRGDALSIRTELIDVAHLSQLWGEEYHRQATNILGLQEEIAQEITKKLMLRLTGEEQQRVTKRYTENTEAHQAYLKGRFYWNKRTAEGLRKGIEFFRQAIEKDPSYALGYAGLADCYNVLSDYDTAVAPREAFPKAKAAALKAVELDEQLAEAHASLAYAQMYYEWDWAGAEREYRRALELNPHYPTAHQWYAEYLTAVGRFDEAIAEMRRAQELDPLSLIISADLGWVLYRARRYDEAIAQARKTLEMDQSFLPPHTVIREAYEAKGMPEETLAAHQRKRALVKDSPSLKAELAHLYAAIGQRAEAGRLLNELLAARRRQFVSAFDLAQIFALLGEQDQALEWLEQADEERSVGFAFVKVDPDLDHLRQHPGFKDLLRRLGLAP